MFDCSSPSSLNHLSTVHCFAFISMPAASADDDDDDNVSATVVVDADDADAVDCSRGKSEATCRQTVRQVGRRTFLHRESTFSFSFRAYDSGMVMEFIAVPFQFVRSEADDDDGHRCSLCVCEESAPE